MVRAEERDARIIVIKHQDVWEELVDQGQRVDGAEEDLLEGQLRLPGEFRVVKVDHLWFERMSVFPSSGRGACL